MGSKDLQNGVLSKYNAGDQLRKIFRDLNGGVRWGIIQWGCKMTKETGAISLIKPPDNTRTVRTKTAIRKVKYHLNIERKISQRIIAKELRVSKTTARWILIHDLQYRPYKVLQESALTDKQQQNRKKICSLGQK